MAAAVSLGAGAAAPPALEQRCTIDGALVDECVAELKMAQEYTDQYLRQAATNRAMAALEARRRMQARAACAKNGVKLGSVTLGMQPEAVRDCGWGRPARVRRTTDVSGTREVWIYEGGRSLSFSGGKVITIED